MWYLIDLTTKQKTLCLLSNRSYKLGRKNSTNADIIIGDDPSVSRFHAEIVIKFDEKSCDDILQQPNIGLTDHSKFGTSVNDVKVENYKQIKANDIIEFGYNTKYELYNEPLIVTASGIKPAVKSSLRKLIGSLCGYFVNDWRNDCSFLVMNEITVTVKCLNALLCQRLIITPKYFEDLVTLFGSSKLDSSAIPDPNDYLPAIGEANLDSNKVCFKPNAARKDLFEDKKFIFLCNDQLQKLQNIIELAGGHCEMFNKLVHFKSLKCTSKNKNNILFLIDPSEKYHQIQTTIEKRLDSLNQRLIDDTEIGMSILYASVEEHCNPSYLSEDHKNTKVINKLCSQTQDIMGAELMECDDTDDEADIPRRAIKRKSTEILDSEQFQFEGKIEHFCVVKDTQEIGHMKKPLNRDLLVDTSNLNEPETKTSKKPNNQIWIEETHDMHAKPSENISPNKANEKNPACKEETTKQSTSMKIGKKLTSQIWIEETQEMLEKPAEKISPNINEKKTPATKEEKTKQSKIDQNHSSQICTDEPVEDVFAKPTKNKSSEFYKRNLVDKKQITEQSTSIIKTQETTLSSESNSTGNKTNVKEISVFSSSIDAKAKTSGLVTSTFKSMKKEFKPLNLTDVKNESKEDWHQKLPSKVYSKLKPPKESFVVKTESQTDQIQSQNLMRIKFESLVRKDFKYEISDSTGSDSMSGKVNFKKFKKVPKNLSQSSRFSSNSQNKKTNSQFRSFKEENFDLDSQFSQFMSSSKR